MLETFTTREIASGLWLFIFFIYLIIRLIKDKNIRKSFVNLVKIIFSRFILVRFAFIVIYSCIIIHIITKMSIWKWIYLKDVILWILLVGVPICYNAMSCKAEDHYFKKMLLNNFGFIVIYQFFINTFTYPLWIEILIQPVMLSLMVLQIISDKDDKTKILSKILDYIFLVFAIFNFSTTLNIAIDTFIQYDSLDILISFMVPIIFSILFIPVAYLFGLYSKYEQLFVRMKFYHSDKWCTRFFSKCKTIFICKLSISNVINFDKYCIDHFRFNEDYPQFKNIIKDYKEERSKKDE